MLKALPGLGFLLLVLGSIAYAIGAQMTEPPLAPAYTFMRWQALWSGGTYGVKLTFAVTWFTLLFGVVAPIAAAMSVVGAIRGARGQPVMPKWPACEWQRMREPARLRLGIGLLALGLLFGGLCWLDAEMFAPVSFLAQIALVLWPFTWLVGPWLILDVALPASVVVGAIEGLERTPGSTPEQAGEHHLRVGGRRFGVAPALWRQLAVGDEVAVRSSAMFDRVLELRKRGE
jgi:hypothetical protein